MMMLTSCLRIFSAKSTTQILIRSFLIGGILIFLYELKKVKNGDIRNPTHLSKNAAIRSSTSMMIYLDLLYLQYKFVHTVYILSHRHWFWFYLPFFSMHTHQLYCFYFIEYVKIYSTMFTNTYFWISFLRRKKKSDVTNVQISSFS